MEISRFGKDKSHMISVSRQEAIALIKSLSPQLLSKNCNSERLESYAKIKYNGKIITEAAYFSIAVNNE